MGALANGITRKYYKTVNVPAEYTDWAQPVLSANGTMGGSAFAVDSDSVNATTTQAWKAFRNSYSSSVYFLTGNGQPHWLTMYNPIPLKVASFKIKNRGVYGSCLKDYEIYTSDDNNVWTLVSSGTLTNTALAAENTITITLGTAHKYWRIKSLSCAGQSPEYFGASQITITAQQLVSEGYTYEIESTADDYDRYEDVPNYLYATLPGSETPYLAFLGSENRYLKHWVQPELTSNTSYGALLATSQFDDVGTHDAWHAFSPNAHQWINNPSSGLAQEVLVWQLPSTEKIYISSVELDGGDVLARFPTKVDVYGSNDLGQTFIPIGSATPEASYDLGATYTLTVNCVDATSYNTIGFALTKSASADGLTAVADIRISAYTDGTPDDYDVVKPPAYL